MPTSIRRRTLLKGLLGFPLAGYSGWLWSTKIEPSWLQQSALTLNLPRLSVAFDGYRIVQLSDLHVDNSWMTTGRLRHIVETANKLAPDLVVITGDFITPPPHSTLGQILSELRHLQTRDGVLAVLGNHDHWTDAAWVRREIEMRSVRELSNTWHTIARNGQSLHIAGLHDLWQQMNVRAALETHIPQLAQLTAAMPSDGAAVLLVHEPDIADIAAANGRFDLQLSGHSHGGQVRIPFSNSPVLPTFGRKYYSGYYRVGNMQLYTHRGLGMINPQVRFNCRPEIAVITLKAM
jgi:predicted MPP superfamily phosphohydrolase